MRTRVLLALSVTGLLAVQSAACGDDGPKSSEPTDEGDVAALLHVIPPGGATDVDPTQPIVVEFDHPISAFMTRYAALHEGDVNGPEVPGVWSLSHDGTRLVFTPDQDLKPATTYTVHLGGGMIDDHGHTVDFEEHGFGMGGQWAWEDMFQRMGSGMGPGSGMGGDWDHPHMDGDWQHHNGSYGMVFSFTTAG